MPGHKGGPGADPELREAIGDRALALDVPALTWGVDVGPEPTPFQAAQALAAEAWGARRSWFLINGASQGNHVALLTLRHAGVGGRGPAQRPLEHDRRAGDDRACGPRFVAPELDPELGIAHCLTPEALDRALTETPDAVGATAVSPTYFGAVADVAGLAEVAHAHGVPLIVDEAWGAHLAFHEDLPPHALSLGADLVISSTHKIVGSLTQSAIVHLGTEERLDEDVVDRSVTLVESTSPNSLLLGSLDAARRLAATRGHDLLDETIAAMAATRTAVRALPGLDVLDERLAGRGGRGGLRPAAAGHRRARHGRERLRAGAHPARGRRREPRAGRRERDRRGVRHGRARPAAGRAAGGRAPPRAGRRWGRASTGARASRRRPPWGELVLTPRDAFFAPQEVVPAAEAVGRVAAESLAAYPPGVPNVLPGERLSEQTLEYVQEALDHGGSLRGASDRQLRTVRVVAG